MTWKKRGLEKSVAEVFLRNIGVSSLEEINNWVRKARDFGYRIDGLKDAVLFALKHKDLPVIICGDYDADGVTSTAILQMALSWAGFKHITYRIPKRFTEGFGINKTMIDEFLETVGPCLLITCDNGVAQSDVINYAKANGFKIIIIDHHQPEVIDGKTILPDADFIIDPHAIPGSADFDGYCGAGLSYRFACELLNKDRVKCRILRGLATIGTIADVMELREENYFIVRYGLPVLCSATLINQGTYALISALGLSSNLTAKDIGFKIAPTINACSRMKDDGANDAIEMLLFDGNYADAVTEAERLIKVNENRKLQKKEALEKARNIIANECMYSDCPLVLNVPDVSEGVIGIIAGVLCEKYKVPVIVTTNTHEGILKGSGRSCGNFDMKAGLDSCSDLLIRYGGHAGAAGLSLVPENFEALRDKLFIAASNYEFQDANDYYYDLEIDARDIPKVLEELQKYEPFGMGNEPIVFRITNFSVIPKNGACVSFIGEDQSVAKIFSKNVTAIGFDLARKLSYIDRPMACELIGTLSYNYFGGKKEAQIEFVDIKMKTMTPIKTSLAAKLDLLSKS